MCYEIYPVVRVYPRCRPVSAGYRHNIVGGVKNGICRKIRRQAIRRYLKSKHVRGHANSVSAEKLYTFRAHIVTERALVHPYWLGGKHTVIYKFRARFGYGLEFVFYLKTSQNGFTVSTLYFKAHKHCCRRIEICLKNAFVKHLHGRGHVKFRPAS